MSEPTLTELVESLNPTQKKCLEYLALGTLTNTQVAAALGITPGLVSQYCAEDNFKLALAQRKIENVKNNSKHDDDLNELESALVAQLKKSVPLAYKPTEVARLFQIVNAAKRRGAAIGIPGDPSGPSVVKLTVPVQIINRFKVNLNNQVVTTGSTDLVTIQSGAMRKLAAPSAEQLFDFTADTDFPEDATLPIEQQSFPTDRKFSAPRNTDSIDSNVPENYGFGP